MLTFGVCLFSTANAAVYYVRTNGNDALPGTCWAQAKQTLGNAIAIASAGDEIWVARGIYAERVTRLDGFTVAGGIGRPLGGDATATCAVTWTRSSSGIPLPTATEME